jgi:hypothetical protein
VIRVGVCIAVLGTACESEAFCLDTDPECSPLYEPTFDEVYVQTLQTSCGIGGSSCHGSDEGHGGLAFNDPDMAWQHLTDDLDDGPWVVAGAAGCSPLIQVLRSEEPAEVMPPGAPLSEAEICAIEQWIDAGAER